VGISDYFHSYLDQAGMVSVDGPHHQESQWNKHPHKFNHQDRYRLTEVWLHLLSSNPSSYSHHPFLWDSSTLHTLNPTLFMRPIYQSNLSSHLTFTLKVETAKYIETLEQLEHIKCLNPRSQGYTLCPEWY
jgi:hypothetical protein